MASNTDSSDSLFLGLSGYDTHHTIWWNMFKADAEIRRNEMRKRLYEFTMVSKGNGMSLDKIVRNAKEYPSACEKCGDTIHEGTYSLTVQETSTNINCKVYTSHTHKLCGHCTASVIQQNAVEATDEANSKANQAHAEAQEQRRLEREKEQKKAKALIKACENLATCLQAYTTE